MSEHSWWIVTTISSCLSILGGLFIIYTYSAISAIQNSARQLLVCLTIADIATAYGNLVGAIRFAVLYNKLDGATDEFPTDYLCVAQSFVTTMSSLSSFFWTSLIALHLFLLVMYGGNDWYKSSTSVKYTFHFIGWIVPGVIVLVAFCMNKLGEDFSEVSGGWCWISSDLDKQDKLFWMLFTGKVWEMLTYLLTTILYILLKGFTYRKRRREPKFSWRTITNSLRREDENFCMTFMILYLVRLWGTVRFFMDVIIVDFTHSVTNADNVLAYFHSYGDSAQAFWNCILFCVFDKTVIDWLLSHRQTDYRIIGDQEL